MRQGQRIASNLTEVTAGKRHLQQAVSDIKHSLVDLPTKFPLHSTILIPLSVRRMAGLMSCVSEAHVSQYVRHESQTGFRRRFYVVDIIDIGC